MKKLIEELENVINNELTEKEIKIIEHAAAISPFVTQRTIGPDCPPWQDEKDKAEKPPQTLEQNASPDADVVNKIDGESKEKAKPPLEGSSPSACNVHVPPLSSVMDFESLNNSIVKRQAEQQRKKAAMKQLIAERVSATSIPPKSPSPECCSSEQSTWLQQRQEFEKELLLQADSIAQRDLKEQQHEIDALRKQTTRQLHSISYQGVAECQHLFRGKYELVAKLITAINKEGILPCQAYNDQLRGLVNSFDQLVGTIKSGVCGSQELRVASGLCKSLNELEENIIEALNAKIEQENAKAAEATAALEASKQQEKQLQQKQLELQQQLEVQHEQQQQLQQQQQQQQQKDIAPPAGNGNAISETPTGTESVTDGAKPSAATTTVESSSNTYKQSSAERLEFYNKIITFYQEKVEKVKPLQSDDNMKKFRAACQKAINIPINAISAVTPQHLMDKFDKLYGLLAGQTLRTTEGGQFSVNDHPLGRDYCILLMAKKFVSQGDTTVSSNPQAAFPIASMIVSIWKLVPEFGQVFLAYAFKESPFLVPYLVLHNRGQPVNEYFKLLGYRVGQQDGQLEPQEQYLKRQKGIARLYAAVMVTNGRQAEAAIMHPYGVQHGWRWLANFVRLQPMPEISATLILEFLQVMAPELFTTYGRQFFKMLVYFQQIYFPKLNAVDEDGGPKTRLQILLNKILQDGQLQTPLGLMPTAFW